MNEYDSPSIGTSTPSQQAYSQRRVLRVAERAGIRLRAEAKVVGEAVACAPGLRPLAELHPGGDDARAAREEGEEAEDKSAAAAAAPPATRLRCRLSQLG